LLVLEKSLCFGYGRDLQEDKRPIFDAVESALLSLRALRGALSTATFHQERLEGALRGGHMCATDLADALVLRGLPFREAHHVVGQVVRLAEAGGTEIAEIDRETLGAVHAKLLEVELSSVLDPRHAVERRTVFGGPARVRVLEAITSARTRWAAAIL
jgi:argininosuccinate lyase